jgi:hypothetical protein
VSRVITAADSFNAGMEASATRYQRRPTCARPLRAMSAFTPSHPFSRLVNRSATSAGCEQACQEHGVSDAERRALARRRDGPNAQVSAKVTRKKKAIRRRVRDPLSLFSQ